MKWPDMFSSPKDFMFGLFVGALVALLLCWVYR